jgi:hypothetical protein
LLLSGRQAIRPEMKTTVPIDVILHSLMTRTAP